MSIFILNPLTSQLILRMFFSVLYTALKSFVDKKTCPLICIEYYKNVGRITIFKRRQRTRLLPCMGNYRHFGNILYVGHGINFEIFTCCSSYLLFIHTTFQILLDMKVKVKTIVLTFNQAIVMNY